MTDIPDISAKRAALAPDKVAMEEVESGCSLTYAELDRRAGQVASMLADRKIGPGDRVAILCRNRTAFFEILFACGKLGAILVPLNWRMPPAELDQLLTDCTPKLLFHGAEDQATVERIMYPPPSIGLDGEYEKLLENARPRTFRPFWPADETWYLLYTSGTTGRPKGVIYTYRMALANYVNIGNAIDLSSNDTTPNFLPLFHTAGINLHSLPTLMAGGCVLVMPHFDADRLVGLIEQGRLDTFFAVPTVFQELLDHPKFQSAPLGRIRHWGCGGAPLPDALAERYRDLGVRICNGMGMTETGPTAFLVAPADAWDHIGSVGKPQLLCSVRIVDGLGKDLADDEVGELLFAGPGISPGYWRNEEATRSAFTEDGWLRSGDLGRRDPDGFYYVTGRKKEMFISGGENVYPAEVENVLCSHGAVAEAAVVARADPKWGEVGRAFILLREGKTAPDDATMEAFCRERLAAYKIPRAFDYVPDFPRTAAGKIQKHLLG